MNPTVRADQALSELYAAKRNGDDNALVVLTLADVAAVCEPVEDLRDGDRWGRWTYHATTRVLTIDAYGPGSVYEVDLDRATNDKERWNWVRHIAGKRWATDEDVGALARALLEVAS